MPHITAPLSIVDSIPTARSFAPRKLGIEESAFYYARTVGDVPAQQIGLNVKWSDSTPKRPTVRQVIELTWPVLRTVNSLQTTVDTARGQVSFVIPDSMTEAEATDMIAFMSNSIVNANIKLGVTKREPLWG